MEEYKSNLEILNKTAKEDTYNFNQKCENEKL